MATIRASCPSCGDVELTSRDVRVMVCTSTDEGSYTFRCPSCLMAVAKPAEPRIVDLLVSAGVGLTTWTLPDELRESHPGSQFTYDDLLDFHFQLQDDSWQNQLTAERERFEQ